MAIDGRRLHFLDGLRGWAALVVVFSHTFQTFLLNPALMRRMAYEHELTLFIGSPLAFLFDGTAAIFLFFVISGFALAYPVLIADSPGRVLKQMIAFRYFRLTIPIALSCLLAQALWTMGAFVNVPAGTLSGSAWLSSFYRFEPSLPDFVRFVTADVYVNYDYQRSWNAVLWTMSVELLGSFALFTALAVLRDNRFRAAGAALACAFLLPTYYFGFSFGLLLAILFCWTRRVDANKLTKAAAAGAVILGIALSCFVRTSAIQHWPLSQAITSTGYHNLVAGLIVGGLAFSPAGRSFLSCRLSRFLGRISYSLYLVHLPLICSVGAGIYLGAAGRLPFWMLTVSVGIAIVGMSVFAATIFARLVEEGLVRRAKILVHSALDAVGRSPILVAAGHGSCGEDKRSFVETATQACAPALPFGGGGRDAPSQATTRR